MTIQLNNVSSGYSTGVINDNFEKLEQYINQSLLNKNNTEVGESNQMEVPLDMNSNLILNVGIDPNNPGSLLSIGDADSRYIKQEGGTVAGELDMGSNAIRVRSPVLDDEPARKGALDAESAIRLAKDSQLQTDLNTEVATRTSEDIAIRGTLASEIERIETNYQAADANLQAQISGGAPLEASAFSPISWHDQELNNSVTIPDGKNAWSFGPTLSIASGQTVTIGTGSFWTIANGEAEQLSLSYDGGTL